MALPIVTEMGRHCLGKEEINQIWIQYDSYRLIFKLIVDQLRVANQIGLYRLYP